MLNITSILAPTDFSDPSKQALDHACALAQSHEAHLHVLHVLEQPSFPGFYGIGASALYGKRPDLKKRAEAAFDKLLPDEERASITTHLVDGRAGEAIVDFAAEHEVDLIVMASKGRSGVERVLIGSVAEYVIRHAQCPLCITKVGGRSLVAGGAYSAE